jgi:hypothetical protein
VAKSLFLALFISFAISTMILPGLGALGGILPPPYCSRPKGIIWRFGKRANVRTPGIELVLILPDSADD